MLLALKNPLVASNTWSSSDTHSSGTPSSITLHSCINTMRCLCSLVLASLLFLYSFKPDLRSKKSPLSSVSFEKSLPVFLNLKILAVSRETFHPVVLKAVLLLYSRDAKTEGCSLFYIFSSKWFLLFTPKKITSSILKLMTLGLIICNLFLSSTAGPPRQASPCLWLWLLGPSYSLLIPCDHVQWHGSMCIIHVPRWPWSCLIFSREVTPYYCHNPSLSSLDMT